MMFLISPCVESSFPPLTGGMHRLLEKILDITYNFSELQRWAVAFSDHLSALPLTQAFDAILKF